MDPEPASKQPITNNSLEACVQQELSAQRSGAVDAPLSPTEAVDAATAGPTGPRTGHWIDLLMFIILTALALPGFYRHGVGDLYSDEADYALASTRGFDANRWDRSDIPREPNRLIAGRHFHAPLTVDVIALARRFGAADRTIRLPFMIAGALSVGTVYLCGLALFDRRREIAAGCAMLVAVSPPIIRMASHALPWSLIILELLVLLWTFAAYTRGRGRGWLAGSAAALGALFVTSEVFFVAAPAVAAAAPLVMWTAMRTTGGRRDLAWGGVIGTALFLTIVLAVWPSGLTGAAIKMLRHYMQMRHSDSFPVNVGSQVFAVAPKWAYLYWYWNDYKPFFVCYAVGIPGIVALAAARKLHISVIPLLSLSGFLLFAAHRAHIIGPEYLAHCLPFLTLLGGYGVFAVSLAWRPIGVAALLALAAPVARWSPRVPLPGMDARAQVARWPAASRFLAKQWAPGDRIIVGSQPVAVAHWYLVYQGGVSPAETQFQTMPVHAPKPVFLERLRSGFYRYIAVSNMFEDNVDLDAATRRILRQFPIVWRSDEYGTGPSRLTVYRSSRDVSGPLTPAAHTLSKP